MNLESNKKQQFKIEFKKRCFYFSLKVLKLCDKLRTKSLNWSLVDQLIRSGTSIGANVVEGGNSSSRKEFINFFQISLKSASETLYWLELLKEINNNSSAEIDSLIKECTEIKKIISTIILNTKNS